MRAFPRSAAAVVTAGLVVLGATPALALPSTGPGPAPGPVAQLVQRVEDAVESTGVRAWVEASPSGGEVGLEVPPSPICMIGNCNPTGPLGEPVIELVDRTLDRVQVDQDVHTKLGIAAGVRAGRSGGQVSLEVPPSPICDVGNCNPSGPLGRLLAQLDGILAGIGSIVVDLPGVSVVLHPRSAE